MTRTAIEGILHYPVLDTALVAQRVTQYGAHDGRARFSLLLVPDSSDALTQFQKLIDDEAKKCGFPVELTPSPLRYLEDDRTQKKFGGPVWVMRAWSRTQPYLRSLTGIPIPADRFLPKSRVDVTVDLLPYRDPTRGYGIRAELISVRLQDD